MTVPAVTLVRRRYAHRLIPSKYSDGGDSVLVRIAGDDRICRTSSISTHPLGSRFKGPDRGAWYAAFEARTAQAEIAFHKSVELAETDRFEEEVTYDDYPADFSAPFHDLRGDPAFAACLAPDSYLASQELAERLLIQESQGVVCPSVRRAGGTCVACFRPALVGSVRKGRTYRFRWAGTREPTTMTV